MSRIELEGFGGYDGSYEIDFSYFTARELHVIKQMSGVRLGEMGEALEAGDYDVVVAMAKIALIRAGKKVQDDVLWDSRDGSIRLFVEEAEDEIPPAPAVGTENSSSVPDGTSESYRSTSLSSDSESSENGQSPIGSLGSASVESPSAGSAT